MLELLLGGSMLAAFTVLRALVYTLRAREENMALVAQVALVAVLAVLAVLGLSVLAVGVPGVAAAALVVVVAGVAAVLLLVLLAMSGEELVTLRTLVMPAISAVFVVAFAGNAAPPRSV